MRFCLQCGASLANTDSLPVVMQARQPMQSSAQSVAPIPLNASPVDWHPRPSIGDPQLEIDEVEFKKSFERPPAPPGAVVCRFCQVPLDPSGEFCEHCGAPVAEAVQSTSSAQTHQPPSAAPARQAHQDPEPQPYVTAETTADVPPAVRSTLELQARDAPIQEQPSEGQPHPPHSALDDLPGPGALYADGTPSRLAEPTSGSPEPAPLISSTTPQESYHGSGFFGRLKGLFKRG